MLAEQVISVIAQVKRIPEEGITLESTFEELEIDSLDGIEIVSELEERFNVSIPDDAARGMTGVRQVVESLRPLVEGDGSAAAPQG